MAWLPDTNSWIHRLKPGLPAGRVIAGRLAGTEDHEVLLCAVVKAELWHGAEKYGNRAVRLGRLAEVFGRSAAFDSGEDAVRRCGFPRHELECRGQITGPNELRIAAILPGS